MNSFTTLKFPKAWLVCGLVLLVVVGCSQQGKLIDQVYELAGDNKIELEKVLAHYKDQPQKLKAAEFLIANMAHGFQYNEIMDSYRSDLQSCPADNIPVNPIWQNLSEGKPVSAKYVYDARVITSDYLIDNIEMAFDTWNESPWQNSIDFHAFCLYILPYRITNEPLTNWRKTLRENYLPYIDHVEDPAKAFVIIYNKVLTDFRKWDMSLYPYTMDPLMLDKIMRGRCEDRSLYLTCVLRSLAIPAAYDYMPFWSNASPAGHSWVSYIQNDSTFTLIHKSDKLEYHGMIDASRFYQTEHNYNVSDLPFDVDSVKKNSRIFRACFEIQKDRMEYRKKDEPMPVFFKSLFIKDVSRQYGLSAERQFSTDYRGNVYLCAFKTGEGWVPLAVTQTKRKKAIFNHLDREVVYLLCGYRDENLVPLTLPFYIAEDGILHEFIPDETKRQDVILRRKYLMTVHWTDRWCLFLGGKFEGSDAPDFSHKDVLHEISDMPAGIEKIDFSNPRKYRYIRFIAPENTTPNFAEIAFLGKLSEKGTMPLLPTN